LGDYKKLRTRFCYLPYHAHECCTGLVAAAASIVVDADEEAFEPAEDREGFEVPCVEKRPDRRCAEFGQKANAERCFEAFGHAGFPTPVTAYMVTGAGAGEVPPPEKAV